MGRVTDEEPDSHSPAITPPREPGLWRGRPERQAGIILAAILLVVVGASGALIATLWDTDHQAATVTPGAPRVTAPLTTAPSSPASTITEATSTTVYPALPVFAKLLEDFQTVASVVADPFPGQPETSAAMISQIEEVMASFQETRIPDQVMRERSAVAGIVEATRQLGVQICQSLLAAGDDYDRAWSGTGSDMAYKAMEEHLRDAAWMLSGAQSGIDMMVSSLGAEPLDVIDIVPAYPTTTARQSGAAWDRGDQAVNVLADCLNTQIAGGG